MIGVVEDPPQMTSPDRYAVVSCHVERPLDDDVWRAFERLLRRRPAGFAITALIRPPDQASGEDETVWLERASRADELGPLGHHTHWGGPTQARPTGAVDPAELVRTEAEWFRSRGLAPKYFCGGGWYLDGPVAETLATFGYVDCSATTFRQGYLAEDAPRLQVDGPRTLRLPSGALLRELPATHSLGMLVRGIATLRGPVHVHFHDWELLDRRRALALEVVLRALRLRRRPIDADELVRRTREAALLEWPPSTIKPS